MDCEGIEDSDRQTCKSNRSVKVGMERKATLNCLETKKMRKSELFYDGNWAGPATNHSR